MEEITLAQFKTDYTNGELSEVVVIGNKIYARKLKNQSYQGKKKVVWATIP